MPALSRVLDRPQSLLVETSGGGRALRPWLWPPSHGGPRSLCSGPRASAGCLTTRLTSCFYAHLGYQLGETVQGLVFTNRRLPATLLNAFPRAPFPRVPPYKVTLA